MSKETNELLAFGGKAINAGHKDAADGEFNPIKDFAEYIPVLLAGQSGLTGIGNIGAEQIEAEVVDQELTKATFKGELSDLDELDAYNLSEGVAGVINLFSYVKRKGYEKGQADLAAALKAGTRSIDDL